MAHSQTRINSARRKAAKAARRAARQAKQSIRADARESRVDLHQGDATHQHTGPALYGARFCGHKSRIDFFFDHLDRCGGEAFAVRTPPTGAFTAGEVFWISTVRIPWDNGPHGCEQHHERVHGPIYRRECQAHLNVDCIRELVASGRIHQCKVFRSAGWVDPPDLAAVLAG